MHPNFDTFRLSFSSILFLYYSVFIFFYFSLFDKFLIKFRNPPPSTMCFSESISPAWIYPILKYFFIFGHFDFCRLFLLFPRRLCSLSVNLPKSVLRFNSIRFAIPSLPSAFLSLRFVPRKFNFGQMKGRERESKERHKSVPKGTDKTAKPCRNYTLLPKKSLAKFPVAPRKFDQNSNI